MRVEEVHGWTCPGLCMCCTGDQPMSWNDDEWNSQFISHVHIIFISSRPIQRSGYTVRDTIWASSETTHNTMEKAPSCPRP